MSPVISPTGAVIVRSIAPSLRTASSRASITVAKPRTGTQPVILGGRRCRWAVPRPLNRYEKDPPSTDHVVRAHRTGRSSRTESGGANPPDSIWSTRSLTAGRMIVSCSVGVHRVGPPRSQLGPSSVQMRREDRCHNGTMTGLGGLVEAAIQRGEWSEALDLLDAGGDAATDAGDARTARPGRYGCGLLEASIAAWEEQHSLLCEAGRTVGSSARRGNGGDVPDDRHRSDGTGARLAAAGRAAARRSATTTPCTLSSPQCAPTSGSCAATCRRHRDTPSWQSGSVERLGNLAAEVIGRTAAARITILEGRVDEGLDAARRGRSPADVR